MNFSDIFIGTPQSKYAGIAILVTLLMVALAIMVSKEKVPFVNKFVIAVILILVSLPGILFSLFQLTCIVTGAGSKNQRWWCSAYAWFITILIVIYAVIVVILMVLSLLTDNDAKMVEQFYAQKEVYDTFAEGEMTDGASMPMTTPPTTSESMPMDTQPKFTPPPPPPPTQNTPTLTSEMFEDYEDEDYEENFEDYEDDEDDEVEYFQEEEEDTVEHFTGTCGAPMNGGGSCGTPSW
jgi:hypothetical protein